jgi:hypothetical protein
MLNLMWLFVYSMLVQLITVLHELKFQVKCLDFLLLYLNAVYNVTLFKSLDDVAICTLLNL